LLDGEQVDGGGARIGVGDDRMGRAEVNTDQIAGRMGAGDGLALAAPLVGKKSLHRRPHGRHARATFGRVIPGFRLIPSDHC